MKKLTECDRERLLDYVGAEPEVNLFFIGDIENFGIDSDKVGLWAFGSTDNWDSVVLRFLNNYVVYSRSTDYDAGKVGSFLKTQNAGMISGKFEIVKPLKSFYPERELRAETLSKCTAVKTDVAVPDGVLLRRLTAGDAVVLADLLTGIDEFKASYGDRESSITKLRTNLARGTMGIGLFLDGALVSCAQATAETSMGAMVVGVATRPEVRGHGYASAVVSGLCWEAFAGGKKFLCLFYDNPQAGRIYNRIGFEPIGTYALLG